MEEVIPLRPRVAELRHLYAEAWGLIDQISRERLSRLGVEDPSDFDYAESKGENTVVFRGEILQPEDCDAYLNLLHAFIVVLRKKKREEGRGEVLHFPKTAE